MKMADIICRWRNGTPKTVVELVNSLPHEIIPNEEFRSRMQDSIWGDAFFRTVYQLACQLALYCESEDGHYYPRFDHDITEDEAKNYLEFWLPRYYVPNPYIGRNGFNNVDCPTYFLAEIYKYARNNPNCTYAEAYKAIFNEEATNNNDIVRNYINNYSKILRFESNGHLTITNENPINTFNFMDRNNKKAFFDNFSQSQNATNNISTTITSQYRPYLTALRTKPFLLLAGISGTGKSRIVRELARACWDNGSEEYKAHKPRNFEMVQVKPNWHDSTELIGYVSRISGTAEFVAGDFLKFVAKAWEEPDVPYFLCLDEMNLAPVEQYFAEYLSVLESRKLNDDGKITTDPILKKEPQEWYHTLVCSLTEKDDLQQQFLNVGITLPQNLIIVGTVNMDETTFSFSRKVLDRAMTIEMNEVNLRSGLDVKYENIGKISHNQIIADSVEGVDVYQTNKEVSDQVLEFLQKVNDVLDGSPFKIAYRTRNEFLIYVVNNLPYNKDDDGNELTENQIIVRSLDEVTCMKILPRIEGDEEKTSKVLMDLEKVLKEQLSGLWGEGFDETKSASLTKIDEMQKRLKSGFTSFWS